MNNEITPPQVQLEKVAQAVNWMERQDRTHVWVELIGREVIVCRTPPSDPARHALAHCGIWNRYVDAEKFVTAVNAAAERLWRAA